jgi:hypothetical protein
MLPNTGNTGTNFKTHDGVALSEHDTLTQDRLPSRGGTRARKSRLNNAFEIVTGENDQDLNKDQFKSSEGNEYLLPPMPQTEMHKGYRKGKTNRLNKKRSANLN